MTVCHEDRHVTNILTILITAAIRDDMEINETRLLMNSRKNFCKESRWKWKSHGQFYNICKHIPCDMCSKILNRVKCQNGKTIIYYTTFYHATVWLNR